MHKKGLVIAVIFLFIAVSIQPVFVVEPSEKVQLFVIFDTTFLKK